MRRRILAMGLAITLALSIAGCGTNNDYKNQDEVADSSVQETENTTQVNDFIESSAVEDIKTDGESEVSSADVSTTDEELGKKTEEIEAPEEFKIVTSEDEDGELTPTQLNSINILNYMTVLTQQINESKGNQMFLESARSTLYNETNLNAVDPMTQAQITQLAGVIDNYRMIDVKRDRLEYINEQNRAQALRQAIPNPVGLLSAVQSGSLLKAAASVVYMAVDSASSYSSAINQAEQQYIKEGWELDDEEVKSLQSSTTAQFNYMCNMVRDYDLPDDYVVRETDIENFVKWTKKTNVVSKISWLEDNEKTFSKFRPYWLELLKDYYDSGDYEKCLEAAHQYEIISTRIIRKDLDYANMLPMVIISAKETMTTEEYVNVAGEYCSIIRDNTKDTDWSLRYFAAQIYIDLYALTKDASYLENAYDIAYYNVNILVENQTKLNAAYLSPIEEVKVEKDASKREKKEVKQYNTLLKDERKVALPPVSEALYLNCDLLFALADELNIDAKEKGRIDAILHEKDNNIFLTEALDTRFRYGDNSHTINPDEITVEFDGEELIIPASCITERSVVTATVSGKDGNKILDDWTVAEVDRGKSKTCSEFAVTYKSKLGKDYKYRNGETVTIIVTPIVESPEETLEFTFNVKSTKKAFVINVIKFERK